MYQTTRIRPNFPLRRYERVSTVECLSKVAPGRREIKDGVCRTRGAVFPGRQRRAPGAGRRAPGARGGGLGRVCFDPRRLLYWFSAPRHPHLPVIIYIFRWLCHWRYFRWARPAKSDWLPVSGIYFCHWSFSLSNSTLKQPFDFETYCCTILANFCIIYRIWFK